MDARELATKAIEEMVQRETRAWDRGRDGAGRSLPSGHGLAVAAPRARP